MIDPDAISDDADLDPPRPKIWQSVVAWVIVIGVFILACEWN